MKKIDSNKNRKELLTDVIFKKYGKMGPSQVDMISSFYQESVMDMFDVTDVKKTFIELTNLFHDDEVYRPVQVDNTILPYLKRNEAFLMALGLKDNRWHILYMSPPYN